MNRVVRVELVKLVRSPVGTGAAGLLAVGITALCGAMMAAIAGGDPQLTAKLGPGASLDWDGLVNTASQITAAGGLLGFAVVVGWMFGREFADGTITSLFALPIGRAAIASAKLAAYLLWAATVSAAIALGIGGIGVALGFGMPDLAALTRVCVLALSSAALAVPAALVATLTRSLLGGVACGILLVVTAQVGVLAGAGTWMPLAAPALWALSGGDGAAGLVGAVVLCLLAAAAVVWCWHRLELDR